MRFREVYNESDCGLILEEIYKANWILVFGDVVDRFCFMLVRLYFKV